MNKLRFWLSSKKLQMAQLHDLQRQLQEAWDKSNYWKGKAVDWRDFSVSINAQLNRVSRERYQERELRLKVVGRLGVRVAEACGLLKDCRSLLNSVMDAPLEGNIRELTGRIDVFMGYGEGEE